MDNNRVLQHQQFIIIMFTHNTHYTETKTAFSTIKVIPQKKILLKIPCQINYFDITINDNLINSLILNYGITIKFLLGNSLDNLIKTMFKMCKIPHCKLKNRLQKLKPTVEL